MIGMATRKQQLPIRHEVAEHLILKSRESGYAWFARGKANNLLSVQGQAGPAR